MNIQGVIDLLKTTSGTASTLTGGVFKSELPRGYALPAACVHRYGGSQDYQMDGPVGVREDQIQIDVYGNDADDCETASEAVRGLLSSFIGTLSDGSIVQACYLERDMDMPFLPHADVKGIANRTCLGFRMVSTQ